MTPEPLDHLDEVGRLVGLLLAGELVPEDCRRLEQILLSDAAALEYYQDYVEVHSLLHWQHALADEANEANDECRVMNDELPESTGGEWRVEGGEPSIQHSSIRIQHLPDHHLSPAIHYPLFTTHALLFSYLIAAVILTTALAVAWAWKIPIYTQLAGLPAPSSIERPIPRPSKMQLVGRITGMVDCQWEKKGLGIRDWGREKRSEVRGQGSGASGNQSLIPNSQSLVSLGDKFALSSGLMEITYDTGAKVILQGPVTYEVESPAGGYLSVGKLTAKLEKEPNSPRPSDGGHHEVVGAGGEGDRKNEELSAFRSSFLIPHSYFAIRTPTATVTDLGTEFGVEVAADGQTTSHVFRGSVELQVVVVGGESAVPARVLHENESAVVVAASDSVESDSRVTVFNSSAKPVEFVRALPKTTLKTLDLVDVVAGGDGYSGRRNRGIDPTSGRVAERQSEEPRLLDDGKYHRMDGLPFVDGVFVPDGRTGKVQIDSAGHIFEAFPTTAYETTGHIWAGGVLPLDDPAQPDLHTIPTELNGIDHASPGHGVIFLHANKGITFDLEAIRRANPQRKLVRFRAVAGNTAQVALSGQSVYADFWVLVDGQPRWQRRQINSLHGAFSIAIPLGDRDRFLTLAATDGGDGIVADWTMFGDPRLELSAKADAPSNDAQHVERSR